MRIESITIENFLGARDVRVDLATPVALIAGRNAAGKSSIRDAVALALTGDLGRVGLKKEAPQLVSEGAKVAGVQLHTADGIHGMSIVASTGKMSATNTSEPDAALPYVLEAQRFAALSPTDRRAFLFGLMGVKATPAEIRGRLMDRLFPNGCNGEDGNRLDRVLPLLRAGFAAADDEAKTRATAAKGAWRAVTGETYGSSKAEVWKAEVPAFVQRELDAAQHQLAQTDADIGAVQQQLGELTAAKKAHDDAQARRGALEITAGRLAAHREKLARDEAELKTWGEKVVALRERAGAGPRIGVVHDLATCLTDWCNDFTEASELRDFSLKALAAYEREHGKPGAPGDAEARQQLPEAERALDLYSKAVVNDKRDLAAAERAAEDLKAIAASTWSAAPLTAAQDALAKLQEARKAQAASVDGLRTRKLVAEGAAAKTRDAAHHHAEVVAWDAIAEALGPNGIPADLLREALQPINDRLEQSAADAEWLRAEVDADMAITGGDRPYRLLSESERWRVDAMLAEAIASISGARLLVLDRFDVLEPGKGREDLFAWLDVLATNGEIDTALVFGTLKGAPVADALPASVMPFWIEGGVLAQPQPLKEAA